MDSSSPTITQQEFPPLRPYQTVLLLKEPQDILKELPYGSSFLLRDFILKANPFQRYDSKGPKGLIQETELPIISLSNQGPEGLLLGINAF
jgi:hypothetical protein